MNLLAASVQVWAKPEILMRVPKKDFSPPPEVDGAVVKLETSPNPDARGSGLRLKRRSYYSFIKILFKQPRKTILNNLLAGYDISKSEAIKILKEAHISQGERPQNLSMRDLLALSQKLKK